MSKAVTAGLIFVTALISAAWYLQSRGPAPATVTFYIAADEVIWDYAPSGMNKASGQPFGETENFWVERGPHTIGKEYKKALYREYTDSTFSTLKPRPPQWEHLGFMGPLVRAQVGDTIRIVFKNNAGFPASVHPHGVFYNKSSEGAPSADGTANQDVADDAVPPGGRHTYLWPVPERAGPGTGDPSSILWMYHSHTNEVRDVNAGLVGPMIIAGRGMARPDGTPKDVDRELVIAFAEMDENHSWYLQENLRTYAGKPDEVVVNRGAFGELGATFGPGGMPRFGSNFKESINGFLYANGPAVTLQIGQRVRWYVMATTNFEIHAPHWHGNTVQLNHMRTDVTALLPMGMMVVDMVPDNPGRWLFHCHVAQHLLGGMQMFYDVSSTRAAR